ncbi:MAG: ribonuclease III [Balneolaceae bacterium]
MFWLKSLFKGKKSANLEPNERIIKLERIIGYPIDNPSLFLKALRHRSTLSQEQYATYDSYERLEFLGDSVLDLIIAEILFNKYPKKDEGFLTKIRAKLVKGDALSQFSISLGIDELLELGEGKSNATISKSILADVFESIIAAIYITKGYKEAFTFVEQVIKDNVDFNETINTLDNYKSALLEYTQAHKLSLPHYKVVTESGPGHNKMFEISVTVDGKEYGVGSGASKKKAEQEAAALALEILQS